MKGRRFAKGVEEWSKAGSFVRKPEKGWLHSDQSIKDGGVCYALKYLGCIEVLKSMRTLQYDVRQQVTKEALYRCCEANGYKFQRRKKAKKNITDLLADHPRTVHSGTIISLTVSISGIVLTEMSSGGTLAKHDMQGISFASGGEKDCPDIVGYVAKDAKTRRACHVLDCPQNLAYDVINTIGQAFELRYKMFLDNPPELLPVPKRFEGDIFDDEQQSERLDFGEPHYDEAREESPDEFADVDSDEFDDVHEYDNPTEEKVVDQRIHEDMRNYQRPMSQPLEMSNYDTPHSTIETQSLRKTDISMEFAIGTQFDAAANHLRPSAPSYDSPLASVPTVDNLSFYETPGATVNGTKRKEDNGVPPSSKWETFDDETACNNEPTAAPVPKPRRIPSEPVPSDISNRADHDALEYSVPLHKKHEDPSTRRTPPPLPKPYEKKNENITTESQPTMENHHPTGEPPRPAPKATHPDVPLPPLPKDVSTSSTHNDLSRQEWFHGPITRQEAENLMIKDGDFLVRESTTNPGQYVLTGLQNGYPKHLLLIDPAGKVRTKHHTFDSVEHLVSYHREKKIPIISSGSVLLLRQPVNKNSSFLPGYDLPV